jgi:long-chain acyl-CoA synthetase
MAKSIIGTFEETVQKRGNDPAARYRDGDSWVTKTWSEMDRDRKILAAGLIQLGFQPRERANILSNTSYKWMFTDLAIQSSGGETVPIYQSNLPHECEYIINDCGAVVIFVEDKDQLQKISQVKEQVKRIRKVIVMNDDAELSDWVVRFSDLMKIGAEKLAESEATIRERSAILGPDDVLTIIYTSGTTGMPKGVVLSHANMLYEIEACRKIGIVDPKDVQLLFLPMAHSFAKVLQANWLGSGRPRTT